MAKQNILNDSTSWGVEATKIEANFTEVYENIDQLAGEVSVVRGENSIASTLAVSSLDISGPVGSQYMPYQFIQNKTYRITVKSGVFTGTASLAVNSANPYEQYITFTDGIALFKCAPTGIGYLYVRDITSPAVFTVEEIELSIDISNENKTNLLSVTNRIGVVEPKVHTLERDINGGDTVVAAYVGNGTVQHILLSDIGYASPCYVRFQVFNPAANFGTYGLSTSDGTQILNYKAVIWEDEINGIGSIPVIAGINYIAITTAVDAGTTIDFFSLTPVTGVKENIETLKVNNAAINLALQGHATELQSMQSDIDTLNNGGLLIKDSLINDKISNELALHPEWTTTVVDKSISPLKLTDSFVGSIDEGTRELTSNKVRSNGAICCFIDDDTGVYVPSIWGSILSQTGIKMGFACPTEMMDAQTNVGEYEQMTLQQLSDLYNDGHDVYSHSVSHPAFYDDNATTVEIVDYQCSVSKAWLRDKGFERNLDIIVYPGGLGQANVAKKNVIRKYFRYGVDTVGGGINPDPLDNWCIFRTNADTGTLEFLKAKVDEAVLSGGLLVFINHAYQLNLDATAQINKIVTLINYIKSIGVQIMPLSAALKIKGNIIAQGEYTEEDAVIVSHSGRAVGVKPILTSQNGSKYLISVDDLGAIQTVLLN